MNKQRQVLVTVTYNELGIIIDTKAEPYEEPNLQPTCNQLATDCISRQAALDAIRPLQTYKLFAGDDMILVDKADVQTELMMLPSAQSAQSEMIKDIRKWINSGNRGNADYFIVDKIEEIINKYER